MDPFSMPGMSQLVDHLVSELPVNEWHTFSFIIKRTIENGSACIDDVSLVILNER